MKIYNHHDKFFKETMGNLEVAKDFLINYLPQTIVKNINLETLEIQKDSFIDENLQETFSDLLFKVDINHREGYLYLLFEHKSYPSKELPLQLLKYIVSIWDREIKKEKTLALPPIIPLVIYHGKEDWQLENNLKQMVANYDELSEEIKAFIPNYQYQLYDLSQYTDEEIKGEAQLKIVFTILKNIFTQDPNELMDTIFKATSYLQEIENKQTGIEYFETFLRYIFSAGKSFEKGDLQEILKRIEITYPEGSELVMTLAEILRAEGKEEGILLGIEKGIERGIEQGMEKGMEKGKYEGLLLAAKNMMKLGMPIKQISLATGLSEEELNKLAKESGN